MSGHTPFGCQGTRRRQAITGPVVSNVDLPLDPAMIRRATPSSNNWTTIDASNWMFQPGQIAGICLATQGVSRCTRRPPSATTTRRPSATIRAARLATFVTATTGGPLATPLPLFLDESEGENGVLYGHLAKANPQWRIPPLGDALAIFMGPDAYVTPAWYATKRETGKVVPTWNYVAVHAYGPVEFFDDPDRLLEQ